VSRTLAKPPPDRVSGPMSPLAATLPVTLALRTL
jgi:hypothetical protein